jgi:hypothetical protein
MCLWKIPTSRNMEGKMHTSSIPGLQEQAHWAVTSTCDSPLLLPSLSLTEMCQMNLVENFSLCVHLIKSCIHTVTFILTSVKSSIPMTSCAYSAGSVIRSWEEVRQELYVHLHTQRPLSELQMCPTQFGAHCIPPRVSRGQHGLKDQCQS